MYLCTDSFVISRPEGMTECGLECEMGVFTIMDCYIFDLR